MALVNIVNMVVLDNPCNFANPFQFEITFECLQELEEDLEWKVIYVGSAHDTTRDQVLDEILVGPVPVGVNKFVLQAEAPAAAALPADEIVGVTVVLVTCSYRQCEFVRVGYYVNNEYLGDNDNDDEQQQQPPPSFPALDLDKVQRQILADKPRVTKFPISWGAVQLPSSSSSSPPSSTLAGMDENTQQQQQQQDAASTRNNNNNNNNNALEQKMAAAMTTTTTTSGGAMETD